MVKTYKYLASYQLSSSTDAAFEPAAKLVRENEYLERAIAGAALAGAERSNERWIISTERLYRLLHGGISPEALVKLVTGIPVQATHLADFERLLPSTVRVAARLLFLDKGLPSFRLRCTYTCNQTVLDVIFQGRDQEIPWFKRPLTMLATHYGLPVYEMDDNGEEHILTPERDRVFSLLTDTNDAEVSELLAELVP